jgi:hypothetical protein
MNTIQPEVVYPRWVQVAESTLAQHRNLSQEKNRPWSKPIIGWDWNWGPIQEGDMSFLTINGETKKRWEPMSEEHWEFLKRIDCRAGSTCRYCPSPATDGYDRIFPERCNDCNTLNSYRARGRKTAKKLVSIKKALDLESVLWTMTFPLVYSNRPLEQNEIAAIAKERRVYISQNLLRDNKLWHDQFVGINVMECVVTEPGETRQARFPNDPYSREASNMWSYHIHGHYLVLNHKKSKVNLKLAYAKFGKPSDDEPPKMMLTYKHEKDYDRRYLNSRGEAIGERDEMKIMRDYLVGYARKDCIGKYAWNGDKNWRKVRRRDGEGNYFDEQDNELWYE